MAIIPIEHGLMLAAILFIIGLVGVLVRRNILYMLMSVEIMLITIIDCPEGRSSS